MGQAVMVLLVEDDPLIRELLEETLVEAGFGVETADSGERAISVLDAPGANHRALVTDVNLSGGLTGCLRPTAGEGGGG